MNASLSRVQSAVLGLVVATCLGLAGWGLYRIGAKQGGMGDTFELNVKLIDAQDLEPGSPVRIRGVEAGQVVALIIPSDDPDHVQVRLKLARVHQSRLFANAKAQVSSKGLLGAGQLSIDPGTSASGPLEGNIIPGEPGIDLQSVAIKLSKIADKADVLLTQVQQGKGTVGKLLNDDDLYRDLKSIGSQAQDLLAKANQGIGAMRDELDGMKEFIRNGNDTITAIRQDAEAVRGLPIIRSYIEDPISLLVRPQSERQREIFSEDYLFEPGRATLTTDGRARLLKTARWLNENKFSYTEVVIAGYADPKNRDLTSAAAKKLTEKQAEAVADFLKDQGVARLSWLSSRKVAPLGMGQSASPLVEKEPLPASRVEVILFTQK